MRRPGPFEGIVLSDYWPDFVKWAVLQTISLAHRAITYSRSYAVNSSIQGSQRARADVVGDWREEIIVSLEGELRIYVSTIPAKDRRPCLMQNPIYSADVAHLTIGCPQPPMPPVILDSECASRA